MKKFLLILFSVFLLTGCSDKTSESSTSEIIPESTTESQTEIPTESETEEVTEAETEEKTDIPTENNSAKPTYINNSQEEYPKVTELKIEAPSETDLMNSYKIIFSVDGGYYYDVYIGGRDSANYVLGFDSGDGNAVPINDGEDCTWKFIRDGILYGLKYDHRNYESTKLIVVKYENQEITPIVELNYYDNVYFSPEYIYYKTWNGDFSEFYRTDYTGSEAELIFRTDDDTDKFIVDENKIYYNRKVPGIPGTGHIYNKECGIYDMRNDNLIAVKDGRTGRINGGYMYYLAYNSLMRMNIENYATELVCEDVSGFEFCGDTIFFSSAFGSEDSGTLYKLENGEKQKIFDAAGFFGTEYYYEIWGIQYEGGRIFIHVSSGPYYSYIAEIDSNGNFIRKFYENAST